MSRRVAILASASIAGLLAASNCAQAQQSGSGADASQTAPSPADEIIVTGVRASLASAVNAKRLAPSNINVIAPEDLGRFTDSSIADALQRVPGVEVQRDNRGQGPGTNISIRGLGGDYVLSTVNGREFFGNPVFGNFRVVDYDSIPSEVLTSTTVFKSPTADLIEPGMAGEIDLRTLRPLDYKNKNGHDIFAVLNAESTYDVKAKKPAPKVSAVIGGKFLDGKLGVFVDAAFSKEITRRQNFFVYGGGSQRTITTLNADGTTDHVYTGLNTPQGFANGVDNFSTIRRGLTAGVQVKPDDHWDINFDLEYNRQTRDLLSEGGGGYLGYQLGYNYSIYKEGLKVRGNDVTYLDSSKVTNRAAQPYISNGTNQFRYTDQFITGGFNAAYDSHTGIRATVDYAHSHSDYMFRQVGAGPQGVLPTDYLADLSGATPTITLLAPVNFADPTNYVFNGAGTNIGAPGYQQIGGAYIVRRKTGGTRDQVRVDFEFTPVDQYKIKVGARYSTLSFMDRNVFFNTAGPGNLNQPTGSLFNGTIQEAFFPATPRATLGPILAANPKWSQFLYGSVPLLGGPLPLIQNATDTVDNQFSGGSANHESTMAVYGQIDGAGKIGTFGYRFNVGARALNVREENQGYQGITYTYPYPNNTLPVPGYPNNQKLVTVGNEYWRVLPAANIVLEPTHNTQLRMSYNKSLSLPVSSALIPSGGGTVYFPYYPGEPFPSNSFGGGNTKLKPTTSDNFDVTLEYYPGKAAFVISGFYKKIHDLVGTVKQSGVPVPGVPSQFLFDTFQAVNAFGGQAYGFETDANVPFTFLPSPLDGFGADVNFTFIDSKVRFFLPPEPEGTAPGSSKYNGNATIYYEKYGFSIRAAYTYRSSYLAGAGVADTSDYVRAQAAVDVTATYDIFKNLTLIAGGTNLTRSKEVHFKGTGGQISGYFPRATVLTAGVRLKY